MKAPVLGLALMLLALAGCHASGTVQLSGASSNDANQCDDCKWLVATAEESLSNPANQQLLTQFLITSVCPSLQEPLRQECLDYVPILVPTAVLWINTNLPPPTVCAELAMCTAMKGLHSAFLQEAGRGNGLPCPVCKFMLTQLLAQVQDPGTQASIEQGALQMCALLEEPLQPDCTNNIQDITRKMFVVLADVSVDKACLALQACEPYPPLRQAARPLLPASRALPKLLAGIRQLAAQKAAANDEAQCEECQMVTAELKSLLANPDTRQQI